MASITRKQAFRYFVMPQVKPRFKALFISGFQYIPFFMALVYQVVRLLPAGHPYTQSANLGKFGIRHVIAAAANNLVFKRENIDQILVFGLILVGIMIAATQVVLFGLSLFSGDVFAQAANFGAYFKTQHPEHDLAFMMMDLVFGIPDMFKSCVSVTAISCIDASNEIIQKYDIYTVVDPNNPGNQILSEDWSFGAGSFPHAIHGAMHAMFQWYSYGLLVVAMMIGIYFAVTVVVETAQTGTPFGKRFNRVWAPIRFVVAFGLLIPVANGLNSSQYIVLYAAKFGSSFATNGWTLFTDTLGGNTPLGDGTKESLISTPSLPELGGLFQFMWTSRVCAETYKIATAGQTVIAPYMVRDSETDTPYMLVGDDFGNAPNGTPAPTYDEVLPYAGGGSQLTVRFGEQDDVKYANYKGTVKPLCGEMIIPLSDPRPREVIDDTGTSVTSDNPPEPGPYLIQEQYFHLIPYFWWGWMNDFDYATNLVREHGVWNPITGLPLPDAEFVGDINHTAKRAMNNSLTSAITQQAASGWADDKLQKRGWGAAGIWYNKVSEVNGVLTSAIMNAPIVARYPMVMELVMQNKIKQDGHVSIETRYKPNISGGGDQNLLTAEDLPLANVMSEAFDLWQAAGYSKTPHTAPTGIIIFDVVNEFFGTSGLYRLRDNEGTHPLAMLVGMGRSLVEAAMKNLGFSIASATAGGLLSVLDDLPFAGEGSGAASTAIGFLMTFVIIGLTVGFVLYYVIPFMPFIYFFFAFSGWIKGIFEAMVGAPLWALAHIRIDGEGLPGSAALNGYMLIFEIFLRPILIVFGMLASISTFSALVDVLNSIWTLVISNVSGFDVVGELSSGNDLSEFFRGPLDQFFYTVVYAIVVYLLAMASFKMIDLIPNTILRWMGQSVQSFGDQNENPTGGLMQIAGVGGQQTIQTLGGGVKGGLQGIAKIGSAPGG